LVFKDRAIAIAMLRLGVVGTTFRRSGQEALARLTLPGDPLPVLHTACGFHESVYLATCNRVEIIFVGDQSTEYYRQQIAQFFGESTRALQAYMGEGAAEHLFCVASAIDAMNPGDAQILGQLKAAYQQALELKLAGKHLGLIFEEAFQVAKRVRTSTALGKRRVSMVSLAVEHLQQRQGKLALIGAGDMTLQCAELLRNSFSLLFVNRTLSRATDLARRFGGKAVSLKQFVKAPPAIDALVTATSSSTPILDAAFFAKLSCKPLIVDLAIPRDVDVMAARAYGLSVIDMDSLEKLAAHNRQALASEIAEARILVDDALVSLRRRLVERTLGEAIQLLRGYYTDKIQETEPVSEALLNKLLHLPTVGLKNLAFHYGYEAVELFLHDLNADLKHKLQEVTCHQLLQEN
jgi:glutamyl-tRNA reductase